MRIRQIRRCRSTAIRITAVKSGIAGAEISVDIGLTCRQRGVGIHLGAGTNLNVRHGDRVRAAVS